MGSSRNCILKTGETPLQTTLKHRKKRNAGLVYEFLVRRISSQLIGNDPSGMRKTASVVRRHFCLGSKLAEELELFDVIRKTRGVSESVAKRVLGELKERAGMIDINALEDAKSRLIAEANRSFGVDFFKSYRVPDYRLLATIQIVLDGCRSKKNLSESVQRATLDEELIRFMTSSEKSVKSEGRKIDPLVLSLAEKRFEEKYGSSLTKEQNVLLESYVRSSMTGEKERLTSLMRSEIDRTTKLMRSCRCIKEMVEDPIMKNKLDEAIKHGESIDVESDDAVQEVMLLQKLCEELKQDGK